MNLYKKPLFSIITVSYNAVSSIEMTILSVLSQKLNDYEYIIIDGGSTDGTLEIIQKYENRITSLVSEPDKGIYDAMNKGIKLAKGQWVNFMNAGDVFFNSEVLTKLFSSFNHNKSLVLYGDTSVKGTQLIIYSPRKIKKHYFFSHTICHQSIFFKKEAFQKVGLFSLDYRIISDRVWLLKATMGNLDFQYINITISIWDEDGFSKNNLSICKTEVERLKDTYFTKQERLFYNLKSSIYMKLNFLRKLFQFYLL